MKSSAELKTKFRIMTIFMAFLFLWGAVGQLFVHVCCEHCHEGFFCDNTIESMVQQSEKDCCTSPTHTSQESSCITHDESTHHCNCPDHHLFDSEETKLESVLPQLTSLEITLFIYDLSRIIPSFIATKQSFNPQKRTSTSIQLKGRDVLLQSQILIV